MIIKVCGLGEANNIRAVEEAGAHWFGFIFYPQSPRFIDKRPAYLPKRGKRVGVFVHPSYREVLERVKQFELDAVQFHGNASPEICQTFKDRGIIVIRALPTKPDFVAETAAYTKHIDYFLFDTPTLSFGGSGRSYDWTLLKRYKGPVPFLLSGGLSLSLLPELQKFSHPNLAGYDLNSGFEIAPGIKDAAAVQQFIRQISIYNEQNKATL